MMLTTSICTITRYVLEVFPLPLLLSYLFFFINSLELRSPPLPLVYYFLTLVWRVLSLFLFSSLLLLWVPHSITLLPCNFMIFYNYVLRYGSVLYTFLPPVEYRDRFYLIEVKRVKDGEFWYLGPVLCFSLCPFKTFNLFSSTSQIPEVPNSLLYNQKT